MKKKNDLQEEYGVLEDALTRFENNELQANEYLGLQAPLMTSCGNFLESVIFSQANRFGEFFNDAKYECSTELGCDDFTHMAHFYQYQLDDCCIHMTVFEKDDTYTIHYVFRGEEAAREKYLNEIETMIDEIFAIINDY